MSSVLANVKGQLTAYATPVPNVASATATRVLTMLDGHARNAGPT